MNALTVRCKLGSKRGWDLTPVSPNPPPPKPPSRIARMLALAYKIEQMIEARELRDYADAARRLGVSRARISQIVDLLLLPAATRERILLGKVDLAEKRLRSPGLSMALAKSLPQHGLLPHDGSPT